MATKEQALRANEDAGRLAASMADQRPTAWDEQADVVVVGYGFAGVAAAITAHDAGAKVLMLEKAPEAHKGGNSRVSGNIVFWPNDVEKAKAYFKGLTGPYGDNISEDDPGLATEMHANRAWLEGLGMKPLALPGAQTAEFPELDGADCVQILVHGDGTVGGRAPVAGRRRAGHGGPPHPDAL